jgi:hypothetical protein
LRPPSANDVMHIRRSSGVGALPERRTT